MYRILIDEFGEAKAKEQFIKNNIAFLTTDENVAFTHNCMKYYDATVKYPLVITSFCSVTAFIVGLWRLPSRKSTLKYTLWGLTGGIVTSYGVWRYSMFNYYQKLNQCFRTIIRERYVSDHEQFPKGKNDEG